jgi:hypothetical protein
MTILYYETTDYAILSLFVTYFLLDPHSSSELCSLKPKQSMRSF